METDTKTITAMAELIDSGLDHESIQSISTLLKNGVHPDALAALIIELRRGAGGNGTAGGKWRVVSKKWE